VDGQTGRRTHRRTNGQHREGRDNKQADRYTDRRNVVGAYNLSIMSGAAAVCSSQCRRTGLRVPRHFAVLRGTADRQRVDAVRVSVTVAAVTVLTAVTRRPDEHRAQATTTLSHNATATVVINLLINSFV